MSLTVPFHVGPGFESHSNKSDRTSLSREENSSAPERLGDGRYNMHAKRIGVMTGKNLNLKGPGTLGLSA